MKIEFNKVIWYSIVMAIIIYVGTFAIAFGLGLQLGIVWADNKIVSNNLVQPGSLHPIDSNSASK